MPFDLLRKSVSLLSSCDLLLLNREFPSLGWRTPDLYSGCFEDAPRCPGLYVFTAFHFYKRSVTPMYVGQSKNIYNRFKNHNIPGLIYSDIEQDMGLTRWFLRFGNSELREAERFLISQLNPPYNIACRTRGAL